MRSASERPDQCCAGVQHDLDRADARALPPVELDGVVDAGVGQPRLDAERHDEERRPAGLGGERLDARLVEMVVVVVRDRAPRRCAAARRARAPAATWRFGPAKPTGEARSEKIGSVSMLAPPAWISMLAWPIQVTAGTIARAGDGVGAQEGEVGRRRAASRAAAASAGRRAAASMRPLQQRADALAARTRRSCSGSGRRVMRAAPAGRRPRVTASARAPRRSRATVADERRRACGIGDRRRSWHARRRRVDRVAALGMTPGSSERAGLYV